MSLDVQNILKTNNCTGILSEPSSWSEQFNRKTISLGFLVLVSAEPALVLVELLLFAEQWWQQRVSGLLVGKLRGDGLEPEPL